MDIPVVTSPTTVVVSGATEEIELSVDVGATGPRGSKIFSGTGDPPTSPTDDPIYLGVSQFKVGDMYVQRLDESIKIYYYFGGIESEQWSVPTSIDAGLPLSGGMLTDILDMGSNKITNVATPANDGDAATKQYVDGKVGSGPVNGPTTNVAQSIAMFADDSGTLLADSEVVIDGNNNLDLKNNKITNVATPTLDTEATNKAYVDSRVEVVPFKIKVVFVNITMAMNTAHMITLNDLKRPDGSPLGFVPHIISNIMASGAGWNAARVRQGQSSLNSTELWWICNAPDGYTFNSFYYINGLAINADGGSAYPGSYVAPAGITVDTVLTD